MRTDVKEEIRWLEGGCGCGAVRYRVADAFIYGMFCLCSGCRAATGAASKPMLGIGRTSLEVIEGERGLTRYGEDAGYAVRCQICGSFLYSVVRDGQFAHAAMGSLRDAPTRLPDRHIFVDSKADWETVTDGLPQYEGYGP